MRVVDDVVLATLRTSGMDVYDGAAKTTPFTAAELDDTGRKVVPYRLPYLVYYSSVGAVAFRRLDGRHTRQSVYFSITFIGADRNQTKWAGENARALLEGKRLTIPGHRSWLCICEVSTRVFRDDDAVRPDGSPLFYGTDEYALSITLSPGASA